MPLPDFYSAQDGFNIEEGFEDGDTEGSGRAIPLPPDLNSIHNMSNISEHPKFKFLLEVSSSCKGSKILFKYVFGSSKVIPYKMTNRLKYTSYSNLVFIKCTTFPGHSFKDNCMNCCVCFTTNNMPSSKLGIVEGIDYNIVMSPGSIVDGVL